MIEAMKNEILKPWLGRKVRDYEKGGWRPMTEFDYYRITKPPAVESKDDGKNRKPKRGL